MVTDRNALDTEVCRSSIWWPTRRGPAYLERDCRKVCAWLATRGLRSAEFVVLFGDLMVEAVARR